MAAVLALSIAAGAAAQPLSRLRGRVVSAVDGPIAATVRIEALFGFRGDDYTGQKTYELRANGKGDWALIGFRSGAWMFEASAPDRLPDVLVLPINISMAPSSGVAGDVPTWHPVLRPTAVPQLPIADHLREALDAARRNRAQDMVAALARIAESNDAGVLTAAGRICLIAHDPASARPFFRRALQIDPQSFGAALGMGSSALMQRDFVTAAREFHAARALTKDKDEQTYLSAAVNDLNKVPITWKRTGH